VFLALCPKSRGTSVWELTERGRAVAVLLGDKVSIETRSVNSTCKRENRVGW